MDPAEGEGDLMKPRRRVLLVEDGPGDARLIREMLGEAEDVAFDVQGVDRLAAALAHLNRTRAVDVVLLDLGLPDSDGLDTFRAVRAAAPWVLLVVLTGFGDKQTGSTAVAEGARGYLVKGQVDGELIGRAIRYAIDRHQRVQSSGAGPGGGGPPASPAPDVTLVVGSDGTVRYAGPSLGEMLGGDAAEVVGNRFFDLREKLSIARSGARRSCETE